MDKSDACSGDCHNSHTTDPIGLTASLPQPNLHFLWVAFIAPCQTHHRQQMKTDERERERERESLLGVHPGGPYSWCHVDVCSLAHYRRRRLLLLLLLVRHLSPILAK